MKIDRIELIEIGLKLVTPFETSFGTTTTRRIMLVKVFAEGICGWGESTAPEAPFYNHESIDTAWVVISKFIAPSLLGQDLTHPSEVAGLFSRIRGNKMACAAVETAVWGLFAIAEEKALHQLLGGERKEIECGVSIGLQPSLEGLLKKIGCELEAGYRRIKIKIKPGQDIGLVRAVRQEFPNVPLMVDANSAYTLEDKELFREMDDYKLMMIEQPLAHDDIIDHAELQSEISTPICLDESILTVDDARKAFQLGACKIINIKLGRVGGYKEASLINNFCLQNNIAVWCGGMLESGVGRAHNIALSTLSGFTLPGDVSASKRYWDEDIIEPEVEVTQQGTIIVPNGAGIGYRVKEKRLESLTSRREVISDFL